MTISTLRNITPSFFGRQLRNVKWRKLTDVELDNLMYEKQVISNCYDMSVRHALLASEKGREMMQDAIKIGTNSDNGISCKVIFNINGKRKPYVVSGEKGTSLGTLITNAVDKMIKNNPGQKPLISRLARFGSSRPCEFNKPSNALRWYTGKEPHSIGENNLHLSMESNRDEVLNLLDKLGDKTAKDYSYVAISSWKGNKLNGKRKFHCLPVISIDKKNKTLNIMNKRTSEVITVSFEDLIKKFKGFVGLEH